MTITEEQKKKILEVFKHVHSEKENIKETNKSLSDLKKTLAKDLGVKVSVLNSTYREWIKPIEKPSQLPFPKKERA